jgi:MauM/NapG family ferredoxin protein
VRCRQSPQHGAISCATGQLAVTTVATAGVLGVLGAVARGDPAPRLRPGEAAVLRPPGALAEEDFLGACIRCQVCRDSCPVAAIRPAAAGDPAPAGTPLIKPVEAACTLCLACTQACPTGALVALDQPAAVNMGTAVVDERTCVSHNRTGVCGACHTACPLRNFALTQDLHNAPIVNVDHCVGCGLCEAACIIDEPKAIRVFSNRAD